MTKAQKILQLFKDKRQEAEDWLDSGFEVEYESCLNYIEKEIKDGAAHVSYGLGMYTLNRPPYADTSRMANKIADQLIKDGFYKVETITGNVIFIDFNAK